MDRLIALLSVPPPGLRNFVVFPAVLVFAYTVLLAMEPALNALGLSAFVLAVVFALFAGMAWQAPVVVASTDMDRFTLMIFAGLNLAILAVLAFGQDPLLCQRFFTIVLILRVIFLAQPYWQAPEDLALMGGPRSGSQCLMQIWRQWKLISLVMLLLVNETAIKFGTLTEWIIVWSVAPVVAYCLMYWTIMATWDDEADAE